MCQATNAADPHDVIGDPSGFGIEPDGHRAIVHKSHFHVRTENAAFDADVLAPQGDAEMFVEICEDQYDMVIVDIFEDDITPPQFCTEMFLSDCKSLLRPGGLLLFNRLHGDDEAVRSVTERFFVQTFKKVFEEGWYIDTKGNWILCGEQKA